MIHDWRGCKIPGRPLLEVEDSPLGGVTSSMVAGKVSRGTLRIEAKRGTGKSLQGRESLFPEPRRNSRSALQRTQAPPSPCRMVSLAVLGEPPGKITAFFLMRDTMSYDIIMISRVPEDLSSSATTARAVDQIGDERELVAAAQFYGRLHWLDQAGEGLSGSGRRAGLGSKLPLNRTCRDGPVARARSPGACTNGRSPGQFERHGSFLRSDANALGYRLVRQ
jgi:hypothetical protein